MTTQSNKKMTKKQKSQISVWSEINSSLVGQFGPKQPVEEVVVDVVVTTPKLTGQEQIIQVLQQATQQLKENKDHLTKADVGRSIFEEELKNGLVRKTTIDRLMKEALLTKAGAATYFQNMKKKAGLVNSKV